MSYQPPSQRPLQQQQPQQQPVFVIARSLKDPSFYRGDILACCKLFGLDSAVLDESDYPMVCVPGLDSLDLALKIASRSCMIMEVILVDAIRYRTLDDLSKSHAAGTLTNKETSTTKKVLQRKIHYLGPKPKDYPADTATNLFCNVEAWIVISRDGHWCVRQGKTMGHGCRNLLTKYTLKQRQYLGPTSLSSEMAFLMANQCLARPGKLILDPYVGTGGGLIGVVHFGAVAMGAEIDWKMVEGAKGNHTFDQYHLTRYIY